MASDADVKVRKKRREHEVKRGKVSELDIEVLTSAGHQALKDGRTEDALSCFKNALQRATQLQDCRVHRACSVNLGAAYVEAGHPQRALDFLQKAVPGSKSNRIPDLQFNLALAHNALGQSQEAAAYFLQAAHLYRSQGAGGSEGDACMEVGRCYMQTQHRSLAVQGFLRAAESYRVAAMLDSAAAALKEAGSEMVQSDEFKCGDIMSVLTECLSFTDSIKDSRTLGELYLSVGVCYCRLRCFKEAVQCFQEALGPAAQWPCLLAKVLHNMGAALNSVGQFKSAVGYHQLAAGLYGSLCYRGDQARCFSNLALAYSQLNEEEEAAESLIHALQGFRDTEDHLAQVQICESLAECYLKQRKQNKAIQLYKEALSVLYHCKDGTGQVCDHLVERLTAALHQSLTISPQRPCPPIQHTQGSPIGLHVRQSNQQQDRQKEEGTVAEQELNRTKYMSVPPGLQSLKQSVQQQRSESLLPHTPNTSGELWEDRENPAFDSKTSLVQEAEAPRDANVDIIKSPMFQWKTRFCCLM